MWGPKLIALTTAALIFMGGTTFAADGENRPPADYKKTYDNIPAKWEQFYLSEEQIDAYRGDEIDEVLMTDIMAGQVGDGLQLAGGAWFTVIGEKSMIFKDQDNTTSLIEFRHCRGLDRAKYIFIPTEIVEVRYRRNGQMIVMTHRDRGFIWDCRIEKMYDWNGPTFYIEDIKRPERTYRNMDKVKRDKGTRIGRLGH